MKETKQNSPVMVALFFIFALIAIGIFIVPFFSDLITSTPPGCHPNQCAPVIPQPQRQAIGDGIWWGAAIIGFPVLLCAIHIAQHGRIRVTRQDFRREFGMLCGGVLIIIGIVLYLVKV